MDVETIRDLALSLPGSTEDFPFGPSTLVFKVENKIFLLLALDEVPLRFNVKCRPDEAIELRENFPGIVLPGYHMNKRHWNTVVVKGSIKSSMIRRMIENSYRLVNKVK
ncbi:MAG: MmcQ/YjbR family DNA-binding protein [Chitinophagaceae bacterium]|nr:MmcQ/YjbR family DNA-binding protein [Chitinophagaceae bacterium]